jgi:hypothetical protein
MIGNMSERRREYCVHRAVGRTILCAPRSISVIAGRSLNNSRAVSEKHHLLWERCRCAWKSKLLLNVQQFFKFIYSDCILSNLPMHIYSYPSTHGISGLAAGGAAEQFEVHRNMMIKLTEIKYLRP